MEARSVSEGNWLFASLMRRASRTTNATLRHCQGAGEPVANSNNVLAIWAASGHSERKVTTCESF